MPFIPHTQTDVATMLDAIGVGAIEQLFDEIPAALRAGELKQVPRGRGEMDMLALMAERADRDRVDLCFTGAGSYDHHIPAAVWDIAQRGEFLTAYTPYQAEASQGTLQLIYEFQSMMTALTGMDVSNASVYDGGSGLAEAVLMAVRANKKNKSHRVLVPDTVNPRYRDAARSIVKNQQIDLVEIADDSRRYASTLPRCSALTDVPVALVVQHPNYFGRLEDVDALADWAAEHKRCVDRLSESVVACGVETAIGMGQTRRRHRLRRRSAVRHTDGIGRPVVRFHVLQDGLGAADAGPHHRPHGRPRRQHRFCIDVAGARTTHPPRESDVEHLHEPRPARHRRYHLHEHPRRGGLAPRCDELSRRTRKR